jgi:hypothetical protein
VPDSLAGFRDLLNTATIREPYGELLVAGDAAPYYEPAARVEFFDFADWTGLQVIRETPPPDLTKLLDQGEARAAKIDTINDIGVASLANNEVPEIPCPQGFALVRGWAFDFFASKPASAIYLELDAQMEKPGIFRADYGQERMDNVALFRSRELAPTGFAAALPASRLGSGTHEIRLVVISADGTKYFRTATPVRFRIQNTATK